MKRLRGTGNFVHTDEPGEDINPIEGVANLVDVMLVFACGLMLALITYWNVDVAAGGTNTVIDPAPGVEITEDLSGAGEPEDSPNQESLEEYGTVYRDPDTGKLYVMKKEG